MLDTLNDIGRILWNTLGEMAPFLLFGFLMAGLLAVLIPVRQVERHLGGHGFWPVFKAALFGIPLPLCSCSVIPVATSLRKHGASRGAATAFLISTPQTGVDSILVTLSLLGPVFAVFRPLAALVSGLLGGAVVDVLEPHAKDAEAEAARCEDVCCAGNGRGKLGRALLHGFVELPRDIGRPLLVGVVVAGAIGGLVPQNYFVGVGSGVAAILVMMLVGVPIYVCATASIPIALALWTAGVSPGAVLAFLMTGPATNAAGIATIWKILGPRTAVVYLVSVMVTAFGAGLALDHLFALTKAPTGSPMAGMLPEWAKGAGALVLLVVLGFALFRPGPTQHAQEGHSGS